MFDAQSCVDGACTTYCDVGEAECSDGLDNDGNGYYDYEGACTLNDGSVESCSSDLFSGLGGDDTCQSYCDNQLLGFIEADSGCTSVDDSLESSDYCSYGEAECSDGLDNDGNGVADYAGACYNDDNSNGELDSDEESSLVTCDSETSGGVGISAEDACDECDDEDVSGDSDCNSPLDTVEGSLSVGAPEAEENSWSQFWNWIVFWK